MNPVAQRLAPPGVRLLLRQWAPSDLKPFAALNADPEGMRYFPATLGRAKQYTFESLHLPEVVSCTSIHHLRSEAVMQRLGMRRDPSTFAHPALPGDHWLSEHCLYRLPARR